jgi:hypothetical protein
MAALTGGGWAVSSLEVETALRIVSLLVPTILSIVVFIRDSKRRKEKRSQQQPPKTQ